jgi:hypothetical protein
VGTQKVLSSSHWRSWDTEKSKLVEIPSQCPPVTSLPIHNLVLSADSGVCDQKTSKFFVLCGRIHGRTHGYKWSLLKIREGKYKGEHGGAQVESGGREHASPFQVLLKPMLTHGKGRTRWFPSNNQWVGRSMVNLRCNIFLWVLNFP